MSPGFDGPFLAALTRHPVQARMLGWLAHALGPAHPLTPELLAAGDPEAADNVTLDTWRALIGRASESAPGSSHESRLRWLGARVTDGFFASDLGGLIAQSLNGAPAERYVATLPKVFALSRSDVSVDITPSREGGWRVEVCDRSPLPDFIAGSLEAALHRAEPRARVDVVARSQDGFALRAHW